MTEDPVVENDYYKPNNYKVKEIAKMKGDPVFRFSNNGCDADRF